MRRTPAKLLLFVVALTGPAGALAVETAKTSAGITETEALRPLMIINADGTGLHAAPGLRKENYGSPDWSPDGKWIAYDVHAGGTTISDTRIEIVRSDGSRRREVGSGSMPSWSPDGKQIVCHTSRGCVVMNVDGSGREVITQQGFSARWSPLGARIAYVSFNVGIGTFDLATGKEKLLVPRLTLNQGLSISPDGRRICFGAQGGVGLAELDEAATVASVRWLVREGDSYHSSWAPEGRRVVFNWQKPGAKNYQLYVMDIESDEAPQRLKGQDGSRGNHDPDWSPDGKQIVFASDAGQ